VLNLNRGWGLGAGTSTVGTVLRPSPTLTHWDKHGGDGLKTVPYPLVAGGWDEHTHE